MHCNICDRILSETEIIFNTDIDTYEPCSTCLTVALDAAYSQGFSPDGETLDDPDMPDWDETGPVETLDPDFQRNDEYESVSDVHYFEGFDDE